MSDNLSNLSNLSNIVINTSVNNIINNLVQTFESDQDNNNIPPLDLEQIRTTNSQFLFNLLNIPLPPINELLGFQSSDEETEGNEETEENIVNIVNRGISTALNPNSSSRVIQRVDIGERRRQNLQSMRDFFNNMADDTEEQIMRHVLRESFDEDQQKRLIDTARKLDIRKCFYNKDSDELSNNNTCRICFEEYIEKDDEIGILPCKHFFHNECIQEWGKRKPNCPYCDIKIPTVNENTSNKKQKTN